MKYIQRLRSLRSQKASTKNDTRIFAIALILAQKYSDDSPFGNKMWAKVVGVPCSELYELERRFLCAIYYDLGVGEEEYSGFCKGIQALAIKWNKSSDFASSDFEMHSKYTAKTESKNEDGGENGSAKSTDENTPVNSKTVASKGLSTPITPVLVENDGTEMGGNIFIYNSRETKDSDAYSESGRSTKRFKKTAFVN